VQAIAVFHLLRFGGNFSRLHTLEPDGSVTPIATIELAGVARGLVTGVRQAWVVDMLVALAAAE